MTVLKETSARGLQKMFRSPFEPVRDPFGDRSTEGQQFAVAGAVYPSRHWRLAGAAVLKSNRNNRTSPSRGAE